MNEVDEVELVRSFENQEHKNIIRTLAQSINEKIQEFHGTGNEKDKIKLLGEIYEMQQHANDDISERITDKNSTFINTFHKDLYLDLKVEFVKLGVYSLEKSVIQAALSEEQEEAPQSSDSDSLKSIIANMNPKKLNILASELKGLAYHGAPTNTLYEEIYRNKESRYTETGRQLIEDYGEEGFQQFSGEDRFKRFLEKHTIEFLGGGNSLNFLVTNIETGEQFVLKVGNRLGTVKTAENRLLRDESAQSLFTQKFESRQAEFDSPGDLFPHGICEVSVEEYCPFGDLKSKAENLHRDGSHPENFLPSALHRLEQVGAWLARLEENEGFFPDAKLPNFLINKEGEVVVADLKAICNTTNGIYTLTQENPLLRTAGFIPPEYGNLSSKEPPEISAGKAHSYLFGKNIYQFLTNCHNSAMDFRGDASDEARFFKHQVFKTPIGQELKLLIKACVNKDPAQRPPMSEALIELQIINAEHKIMTYYQTKLEDVGMEVRANDYLVHNDHLMELLDEKDFNMPEFVNAACEEIDRLARGHQLIAEIESLNIGRDDQKLNHFCQVFKNEMYQLPSPTEDKIKAFESILENLSKMHSILEQLPAHDREPYKQELLACDIITRAEKLAEKSIQCETPVQSSGAAHREELRQLREEESENENQQKDSPKP